MNLEDLGRRAVACKHWRWMPGMLASDPGGNTHRVIWHDAGEKYARTVLRDYDDAHVESSAPVDGVIPDLADPATLGCLLHLVREAYKSHFGLMRVSAQTNIRGEWYCNPNSGGPRNRWHATEAEALVAALEAAP